MIHKFTQPADGNKKEEDTAQEQISSIQHLGACLEKVGLSQDREAFHALFKHYAPLMRNFAYKLQSASQPANLADEIVQESMLKIWLKAASFDAKRANANTWVFTLVRNTRIDLLRKHRRTNNQTISNDFLEDSPIETQDIWLEGMDNNLVEHIHQEKNRERMQQALHTLPKEQSLILRKLYLEDKSHTEVANELLLPLGTVKSRVRLALNKLRISLDR